MGLSKPSRPGKWIPSSPLKSFTSEVHRLQLITASPNKPNAARQTIVVHSLCFRAAQKCKPVAIMRNNSWLKEHEFFGLFQSPGTHYYRPSRADCLYPGERSRHFPWTRHSATMLGHDPDWTHHTSEDKIDKTEHPAEILLLWRHAEQDSFAAYVRVKSLDIGDCETRFDFSWASYRKLGAAGGWYRLLRTRSSPAIRTSPLDLAHRDRTSQPCPYPRQT
jgi:hypothetical protein